MKTIFLLLNEVCIRKYVVHCWHIHVLCTTPYADSNFITPCVDGITRGCWASLGLGQWPDVRLFGEWRWSPDKQQWHHGWMARGSSYVWMWLGWTPDLILVTPSLSHSPNKRASGHWLPPHSSLDKVQMHFWLSLCTIDGFANCVLFLPISWSTNTLELKHHLCLL